MDRPSIQPSCAKLHLDHFSILFISHWSFLSEAPRSHAEIGQKKTNRGRDGGSTIPKRKFAIKMICISFIRHSGQIVLVVDLIPFMCPKRKLACRRMVFVHPFTVCPVLLIRIKLDLEQDPSILIRVATFNP
jgi:hypothetical protein